MPINEPRSFAGEFIAHKPSPVKDIRWGVGEKYKVCNVRPPLPNEQGNCYVTLKPVEQTLAFQQWFEMSEETFRECFNKVQKK